MSESDSKPTWWRREAEAKGSVDESSPLLQDDARELSRFRLMFYNAMNTGAMQAFPTANECEIWLNDICTKAIQTTSNREVTDGFDAIFGLVPEAEDESGKLLTLADKITRLADMYHTASCGAVKSNSKSISGLEVFLHMQETDDKALKLAPLGNIVRANYYASRGTEVTIGVEGNICFQIEKGELVGGLFLVDRKRYQEVKAELEQKRQAK